MPLEDTTDLIINSTTQYFFDNSMVGAVQNITRTMHSPQKVDTNPLIQSDRPWEHITYFTCNGWQVWRDAESGRTNCIYEDWKLDRDKLVTKARGTIHAWVHARMRYLYAYSDNGIDWVKPPMGITEENGHDTNIVFGSEEFGSVHGAGILGGSGTSGAYP